MMAVVVGVLLQIRDDGWLAPSSLFFFVMAGEFIATAMLHPSEFYCLKYGVIYYVTVPSMYMLLVIYSVFNMNNVSWGTREVTVMTTDKKVNNIITCLKITINMSFIRMKRIKEKIRHQHKKILHIKHFRSSEQIQVTMPDQLNSILRDYSNFFVALTNTRFTKK